jgi:alanine racemase
VEESALLTDLRRGNRPWPCWIEVDLDAVRHNATAFQRLVSPGCRVMAVVKAEAYGHGAIPIARAAIEAGIAWLGVARAREGMRLRECGISLPILVLGPIAKGEEGMIVEHDLRATIGSVEMASGLSDVATAAGRTVPVHIKVDTGLRRYGLSIDDASAVSQAIASLPGLRLEGIFSHFATADDPDESYAGLQLEAFQSMRSRLESEGRSFSIAHMAGSAGVMAVPNSHFDMVRIGISLFGAYPANHLIPRVDLRPALSMHSRVVRMFTLRPGDSVGYGRTFVARHPVSAALVPVGYADGLPRSHSSRGALLVRRHRAPLIGRVSMDQCVADVSECGPVQEGEPVVVIGQQGGEAITIDEFAARSGTINYEALTSLGYRVPRVYRAGGRITALAYLSEGRLVEDATSSGEAIR